MRSVGTLVELLKRGETFEDRFNNPYLKEALEHDGVLFTAVEVKEKFPTIFADAAKPTVLEIGSYMGKNLLEMSADCPDTNFLGLEITYKRAVKCARKIKKENLGNARISLCEGRDFLAAIPARSLMGVCIFFPDPWPKKKHAKNRLTHGDFFMKIQEKMAPGGFVWLKTDSESYFEGSCAAAAAAGWNVASEEQPPLLSKRPYLTQFEELFLTKQLPIYRRVFFVP